MTDQEILAWALDRWGPAAQLLQAVGEMAELSAEIVRSVNQDRWSHAKLVEETADVENMIDQLKIILGPEAVAEVKAAKLERLRQRLEAGNPRG